jgi:hypothetical protein
MAPQFHTTSLVHWKFALSQDKPIATQTIQNGSLQLILVPMVSSIGWRFTMFIEKNYGVMFGFAKGIRNFWKH